LKLFRTQAGAVVEDAGRSFTLPEASWDDVVRAPRLAERLRDQISRLASRPGPVDEAEALAPIGLQEVWAAGVTYFRSRDARIEESKDAGGGDFYARVYDAERPELFFKATSRRVAGPGQPVRIRRDSRWNVPEPELALLVSAAGTVEGYTIGNDMSSRDIEGANPLYLPQAKVYDGCCGLGPAILVAEGPLPASTAIRIEIRRGGSVPFRDETALARLKRTPEELASWLFREQSFPDGCFLLTGTGIVPPNELTLEPGDEVRITIDDVGTLVNPVERRSS
jgi:2-dehydro-3-deoxy-D-arabinonate dehydratase